MAGLFVAELFALPVVVALAVIAVKMLEFALNRDIASSKAIARNTTFLVVGTTVLALLAWFRLPVHRGTRRSELSPDRVPRPRRVTDQHDYDVP